MKKKVNSGNDVNNGEASKQKERTIVSWSQEVREMILFSLFSDFFFFNWFLVSCSLINYLLMIWIVFGYQEDDILREQIRVHGTDK